MTGMGFLGRFAVLLGFSVLPGMAMISAATVAPPADLPEYAMKANYLTKFAPFVEWPARTFAATDSPLRICVAGTDPFGPLLADIVKGQQVQGHPVTIDHPADPAAAAQCHILFVGQSDDHPAADMLRAMAGKPVLTVTDRSRGVPGGMIQFVQLEGRVRFIIDAASAEASGVQISSKLLELAVMVQR
jgi:hypothetical protein